MTAAEAQKKYPGATIQGISPARSKAEKIPRGMNGWEKAYAAELEMRRVAGEVLWFVFEKWKLKLGPGAWFKPDFIVVVADGRTEFHEVKGCWREAARVRIKVAVGLYPFHRFVVVKKEGKAWKYENLQ